MMGNSGERILPLHTCKRNLANDFSAFFYNKILTIRSELGLPGLNKCGSMTTSFSGTPLTTFMDATEIEIRNIIKLSHAKSCELDPLPTWLLKECIAELVPTITDIVNMSLRDSLMGLPGLNKCGSMTTSFSGTPLTTFMDATEIEIRNIIKLSPAKSCELDPLPTWLLKECIAELVPTITDIVNMSLRDSDAQIT